MLTILRICHGLFWMITVFKGARVCVCVCVPKSSFVLNHNYSIPQKHHEETRKMWTTKTLPKTLNMNTERTHIFCLATVNLLRSEVERIAMFVRTLFVSANNVPTKSHSRESMWRFVTVNNAINMGISCWHYYYENDYRFGKEEKKGTNHNENKICRWNLWLNEVHKIRWLYVTLLFFFLLVQLNNIIILSCLCDTQQILKPSYYNSFRHEWVGTTNGPCRNDAHSVPSHLMLNFQLKAELKDAHFSSCESLS